MEPVAIGYYNTPDTYRHVFPIVPFSMSYRLNVVYTFRIPSKTWFAQGRICGVRTYDGLHMEVIAQVSTIIHPILIVIPCTALDKSLVDTAAITAIMHAMPDWHIDDPWGVPVGTDIQLRTAPRRLDYTPVDVVMMSWSVSVLIMLSGYSVTKTDTILEIGTYIRAYTNKGPCRTFWMGKIVALRAVEMHWFQFMVQLHPDYVRQHRANFVHLSCPASHAKLPFNANRTYSQRRRTLPDELSRTSLPIPLPV